MKRSHLGIGLVLALVAAAPLRANDPKPGTQAPGRLAKEVKVKYESSYQLYLPPDYGKEPDKKWPLIVFLHGSGERGGNLDAVKTHGPPKIVQTRPLQFVIVSPQCPASEWWRPEVVMALTDEMIAKYKVDPDRVYLTGLSMGGFGTWDTAIRYPDRFAAIAPICGGGNRFMVSALKNVPVWAFHGELDPAVPVAESINMCGALKQAGGDVRLTRYPQAGHDAWTPTYESRELYAWFLQHKRGEKK